MTPKPSRTWRAVASMLLLGLALPARGAEDATMREPGGELPNPPAMVPAEQGSAASHEAETPAKVDEVALGKVVELNRKAILAYDSLEIETASALLQQALALCKTADLEQHPVAARTHLHLGVVYISGLKSSRLGLAEFRQALAIDPKIQLTKSLANPEVEAAFELAQAPESADADPDSRLPFPTGQESSSPLAPGLPLGLARISHPLVTLANRGQPVEIKVQVPPGLGARRVLLAYMAQDASEFLAREMTPIPAAPGWFHEHIPAQATRGAWVAYYIEVQDAEELAVAQHGTPEAPHHITLVLPSVADESKAAGRPGKAKPRPGGRGLWVALAVGSGGGYHRGVPEMNPQDATGATIRESGFGFAELLYLAPEVGYFQRDNLILSAQGRLQFITGAQEVRIGQKTYHPAAMAFAGLLKVTWIAAPPGRRFQPLAGLMLGAGQIRHTMTTPASASLSGCGKAPTCHDTILGGLALFGAGLGFRYHLVEGLGFYATASIIAGIPNIVVNLDVAAGFALVR
jgi:hypothetical protein